MITKLVYNSKVIGHIGEDDGDPRHLKPGTLVDMPGEEVFEVTRVFEKKDEDGCVVVEVEPFTF